MHPYLSFVLVFLVLVFCFSPPPTYHPPPSVSCRIEFGMIWLVDWLVGLFKYICFPLVVFLLFVFFFSRILIFILAMNRRGCCLSVNALCCFRHNSSSHVFEELTWCCIILPTYSPSHLLPNDIFFVSFSHSSLPPHASVHWQYIILLSASVFLFSVSFFLFCYFRLYVIEMSLWLGSACQKMSYDRTFANEKEDWFVLGVFLSVSECNVENTQMTWVFAMVQSTAFFIYYLRKLCMQNSL